MIQYNNRLETALGNFYTIVYLGYTLGIIKNIDLGEMEY
jgi:hypothetical protein